MKALERIVEKIKILQTTKAQQGPAYKNYMPYKGDSKNLRTELTAGREKKSICQRVLRRRPSRNISMPGSDFRATRIGKKKRSVILRGLIVMGLVVLLAYAGKGVVFNMTREIKYFQVQSMDIQGCRVTSPNEIREMGGFTFGTSLFSIKLKESEGFLKQHAWIREAELERQWPNRLVVKIREHEPEAMVSHGESGHDKLHYVNKTGICFSPVRAGEDVDFPVITGLYSLSGEHERKQALAEALYFLKLAGMNNPNLPVQLVSEVNIDEKEGMVIYLVDHPFPIYFGRENVKKKYRQLRKVLEILYKKQKDHMKITQVKYIRMDYLTNKVLVAQSGSG